MKIADFGLARGVHQIDYYKKTTNVSVKTLNIYKSKHGCRLQLLSLFDASMLKTKTILCVRADWQTA